MREKPASIHAQVQRRRQCHKRGRILRAVHLLHAHLHQRGRFPTASLPFHAPRHYKTSVHAVRPQPISEIPAAPRAAPRGCGSASWRRGIRTNTIAIQVYHEFPSFAAAEGGVG